jgi:hypothetical protein
MKSNTVRWNENVKQAIKKKLIKVWENLAETDKKHYDRNGQAAACARHSRDSYKSPVRKIILR